MHKKGVLPPAFNKLDVAPATAPLKKGGKGKGRKGGREERKHKPLFISLLSPLKLSFFY